MKYIKQMLLVVFIFTIYFLAYNHVYGQTTKSVNATIKISVCGNGTIEGGEDCEGNDLQGKNCETLGYAGGTLKCDISCDFDTSDCITATPTPTPTSTPTPTVTASSAQTTTSTANLTLTPTQIPILEHVSSNVHLKQNILPPALKNFDLKGNGRIDISELHTVVALWVNQWKQFLKTGLLNQNQKSIICDLNNDGTCELRDFSILLFYVGK